MRSSVTGIEDELATRRSKDDTGARPGRDELWSESPVPDQADEQLVGGRGPWIGRRGVRPLHHAVADPQAHRHVLAGPERRERPIGADDDADDVPAHRLALDDRRVLRDDGRGPALAARPGEQRRRGHAASSSTAARAHAGSMNQPRSTSAKASHGVGRSRSA